jgi:membrane-associated PAP2 superfamily phosphatase
MNALAPFNRWLFFGIPLALVALMLLVEPTRLDFAIANLMYVPGEGFVARHNTLLEALLHDRAKQAVIALGVFAIAGFVLSLFPTRLRPLRRQFGYVVLAMGLSTGFVTPLKTLTAMHCPWSLSDFGGVETYSALLSPRATPVEKAGRCWPGGHAAAGFALFALFFVWRDNKPKLARAALGVALLLGVLFSVVRMAQGAHFLSHNLWTALICWLISAGLYDLILRRQARPALAVAAHPL